MRAGQTPGRRTRGGKRSRKRAFSAASDDASGTSGIAAVPTATAPPARDAYAAAADSLQAPGSPGPQEEPPRVPAPGDAALLQDAAGFATAVFAQVDPIAVASKLLKSEDERISQRQLERLLELRYGKSVALAMEDAPKIEWDLPRPQRQ
jgi:hypothetical protein